MEIVVLIEKIEVNNYVCQWSFSFRSVSYNGMKLQSLEFTVLCGIAIVLLASRKVLAR